MSRYGAMAEAQEHERAAARGIERLRKGVEEAAESVLGSEGQALKTARQELDQAMEAVRAAAQQSSTPSDQADPSDLASQAVNSLRRAEQMLESPALQAEAAGILDRARAWRRETKELDASAPKWDLVKMQLLDPMTELRQNVSEALARVEKEDPLVPADRDPVPGPFRELVRRYYEKLAGGN
jgi:hypothetical protein